MEENNHVLDWLPAYALGSLDKEEKAWVETHLADCSFCQHELEAYQVVAGELPLAVSLKAPPPRLRMAILEKAAQSALQGQRTAAPASTPGRKTGVLDRLSGLLRSPIPAWGLVGAFVLAAALLALNILLFQQLTSKPANTFRVIQLAGTVNAPQASGWIVISSDGRAGTLVTQRLPELKPGQQYQLWLIKDGKRTSGGVFSVDETGYASDWVWSPEPLADYKQFGVTVEPQGGSPGPTGAKVLGGAL